MAFTAYSAQMNVWAATDAGFRIWGKAFTDMLDTLGLTQVYSDIDWTTVLMPTAATTYAGKRVYKFNDSLSTEREIYFSVEFGRGSTSSAPFGFAIRLGVGTAHDGSGVVSNYFMQHYFSMTQAPSDGGDIWGIRSGHGFAIFTNVNSGTAYQAGFSIERLCEAGTPSIDGALMMVSGNAVDGPGPYSTSPKFRVANYNGGQVFNSVGGQSSASSNRTFQNFCAIPDTNDPSYAGKAPAITMDTIGKYDPISHYIFVSKYVYSQATQFTATINGVTGTYRIPYTGFIPENGSLNSSYTLIAFRVE